jgi:hypothetical protein
MPRVSVNREMLGACVVALLVTLAPGARPAQTEAPSEDSIAVVLDEIRACRQRTIVLETTKERLSPERDALRPLWTAALNGIDRCLASTREALDRSRKAWLVERDKRNRKRSHTARYLYQAALRSTASKLWRRTFATQRALRAP